RSAGRRFADRWAARCACRSAAARRRRQVRPRAHHPTRTAAAVPRARSQRRGRMFARVRGAGRPLFDLDLTGAAALLVGGEGAGLAPALIDSADERITIPRQTRVESRKAGVTAAVVLYEARRQRQKLLIADC